MKKTITTLSVLLLAFIGTSAFVFKYSTGIAGYTGSPGEGSCNSCHAGGSSAVSGVTISATPSFTNDQYEPGQTYTLHITANAAGFTHYGFGCEILNSSNANAGVMSSAGSAGPGVTFANAGARKNAIHTTPKVGATVTFNFKWVAPSAGEGEQATIYAAANAVNGNGNSNNDFPIQPVSLPLTEAAPTQTVVTGVREQENNLASQVTVYPNPANGVSNISYTLKESGAVSVELLDISGKTVKTLLSEKQEAGYHSHLLNLNNLSSGVYFVRATVNGHKAAQKLITVQ